MIVWPGALHSVPLAYYVILEANQSANLIMINYRSHPQHVNRTIFYVFAITAPKNFQEVGKHPKKLDTALYIYLV